MFQLPIDHLLEGDESKQINQPFSEEKKTWYWWIIGYYERNHKSFENLRTKNALVLSTSYAVCQLFILLEVVDNIWKDRLANAAMFYSRRELKNVVYILYLLLLKNLLWIWWSGILERPEFQRSMYRIIDSKNITKMPISKKNLNNSIWKITLHKCLVSGI